MQNKTCFNYEQLGYLAYACRIGGNRLVNKGRDSRLRYRGTRGGQLNATLYSEPTRRQDRYTSAMQICAILRGLVSDKEVIIPELRQRSEGI